MYAKTRELFFEFHFSSTLNLRRKPVSSTDFTLAFAEFYLKLGISIQFFLKKNRDLFCQNIALLIKSLRKNFESVGQKSNYFYYFHLRRTLNWMSEVRNLG